MKSRHFLFDLDGTLIDSAPSILECYRLVLDQFALEAKLPLESNLIGPPLGATLQLISGVSDESLLADMTLAFKELYDTTGVKQSLAYPGIDELLHKLYGDSHKLYIVTNKRIVAARKIVDFLNWSKLFAGIYAQDAFDPALPSKASVIDRVLDVHHIPKSDALYIGDRNEDGEAAHANGLKFVWVAWGYGDLASIRNAQFDFEIAQSVTTLESFGAW
jgi:phosphoglycolate phosphatase